LSAEDRDATEDDDAPVEIIQTRHVNIHSEPARPIFRKAPQVHEEDDVPFDSPVSPTAENSSENIFGAAAEKPTSPPKRKAKVEAQPPPPPPEPAADPPVSLRDRLQSFVEVDQDTTFDVFKRAVVELGLWLEAPTWKSFSDISDEVGEKMLKAKKIISGSIADVKGTSQ